MIAEIFATTFLNKIKLLLIFILSIFSPISAFYHILTFMIFINLIIEYWMIKKTHQKFDAMKCWTYLSRVILYVISISVVFLFEKYIINEIITTSIYLTTVITIMLTLYELDKMLTNTAIITRNNTFIRIKDFINSFFKKKMDKIESDENNLKLKN
jgi:hypothetical protein